MLCSSKLFLFIYYPLNVYVVAQIFNKNPYQTNRPTLPNLYEILVLGYNKF